ncbi:MAG: cytochrome c [Planctomycetota bacterium]|nr:cytochrome c [Planctomycetota bacterium]
MPKAFIYATLILVLLAMVPPAIIARQRAVTFTKPRIHLIQDMDDQIKLKAQNASPIAPNGKPLFYDGRAMRYDVDGTVARGELRADDHFDRGVSNGQWATSFPSQIVVDMDLLKRGQERFEIYCQPCHGSAGYGDGIVNERAMQLMEAPAFSHGTTWVQPKSVHEAAIRLQPVGQIFNSITNGVRNMAGYAAQIPTADRWAIVSYIKALQRSQHADPSDLSPQQRAQLGDEINADELLEKLQQRADKQ